MSIVLSFGKYGGFYVYIGTGFRLCLGWMALTILPVDMDVIFSMANAYIKKESKK